MKRFVFTIDDNIKFFRALTEQPYKSLFEHPYLALLKRIHEQWCVKVQLNCFWGDMDGFDLSKMSNRYQKEWEENASWLKLSFHSKTEFPIEPYKDSDGADIYEDCVAVHREIVRFAGANSLAKTTTVHFCVASGACVKALQGCNVQGLLGLYGTADAPQNSYDCRLDESERIRQGELVEKDGVVHAGIDVILNLYEPTEIVALLQALQGRAHIQVMIHEQYFYPDYVYYQPNFQEKLEKTMAYLTENGYESAFLEELI